VVASLNLRLNGLPGPVSGIIKKKKKKKNRGLEFADKSIYSLVSGYQLPHKTVDLIF